jgi:hypothetical protein
MNDYTTAKHSAIKPINEPASERDFVEVSKTR